METRKPMVYLGLPSDRDLLAAYGAVTIRHGQLDYILQMTIGSIEGISVEEAVDATAYQGSRQLRERIKQFAKQKLGEGEALLRLQALLQRAKRVSDKRNEFVHALWAHELDGEPVIRTDDHKLVSVPTVAELNSLAGEIYDLTEELNRARLEGFLFKALANKASQLC